MKVLILEGIATSGKSSLIHELVKTVPENVSLIIAGEEETHIPIMKRTDELCLDFFQELIQKTLARKSDIVIFDRLYLTQALRSNKSLNEYSKIEDMLLLFSPLTVFLKVDEPSMADRIAKAMDHRDVAYLEHWKTKGDSPQEVASYYIDQQQKLLELLKQSKNPYEIFDTTNHDYKDVAASIKTKRKI